MAVPPAAPDEAAIKNARQRLCEVCGGEEGQLLEWLNASKTDLDNASSKSKKQLAEKTKQDNWKCFYPQLMRSDKLNKSAVKSVKEFVQPVLTERELIKAMVDKKARGDEVLRKTLFDPVTKLFKDEAEEQMKDLVVKLVSFAEDCLIAPQYLTILRSALREDGCFPDGGHEVPLAEGSDTKLGEFEGKLTGGVLAILAAAKASA